jgi:hypothetical protein
MMMKRFVQAASMAALAFGLPATGSAAFAGARVVVGLAGEAYDGPPQFEIRMGDSTLGSGVLTRAIDTEQAGRLFANPAPLAFVQEFSYAIPDDEYSANEPIEISLTNDKYKAEGAGADRNLYVDFIEVNGLRFKARDLVLTRGGKEIRVDFQAGMLPVYEEKIVAVANPPASGWPGTELTSSVDTTKGDRPHSASAARSVSAEGDE